MQIFGGYGYTAEYEIERELRSARRNPLRQGHVGNPAEPGGGIARVGMIKRWLGGLIALLGLALATEAHAQSGRQLPLSPNPPRPDERPVRDLVRGPQQRARTQGTGEAITPANLDQHIDFLQRYYREHASVFVDGKPPPIRFMARSVLDVNGGSAVSCCRSTPSGWSVRRS